MDEIEKQIEQLEIVLAWLRMEYKTIPPNVLNALVGVTSAHSQYIENTQPKVLH